MGLEGKHHTRTTKGLRASHDMMKDRLMTAVHTVKVPESEHRLGIGQFVKRCKTLHNLHRSSRGVATWCMVRDIGRWGTITMPAASRNRKASAGALRRPSTTRHVSSPSLL